MVTLVLIEVARQFMRTAEELKGLKLVFADSHICETRHRWSIDDSLVSQIKDYLVVDDSRH